MQLKKTKIWAVTEGPTDVSKEDYPFDVPEDCEYVILCKVEEDNKLVDKEFWFATMQDANNFKNYVDSRMEATEVVAPILEEPCERYDIDL
jgi:hypothetical protein|tara:strand:- start:97 stop:369 length:273 start_codon:yes stop_codon:yes gene_type:complete